MTTTDPPTQAPVRTATVALMGNPNTGKTTLFNRLTGARQRVGNYPGVTVERKTGALNLPDREVTLIDLPGTYSLAAVSADERIAIDVLTGHIDQMQRPDLVVCVADASNVMRNLFLASQIADTGLPVVIALNLMDAAEARGLRIDSDLLLQRLGVPVVPTIASTGQGIDQLRQAIVDALDRPRYLTSVDWPQPIRQAVGTIGESIQSTTGQSLDEAELLRLLFDVDSAIADRLPWSHDQRREQIAAARAPLEAESLHPFHAESVLRYGELGELLEGVITKPDQPRATRSESIDRLLTHRFWGLATFASVMFVVFYLLYFIAQAPMTLIEEGFNLLGGWVEPMLAATPMLQALVVDGLIAGVGGVLVFLPQILILFFFISLIEDTGYMARAAFLMDKLFSWCGLTGKSFVPMLSSYACAVPGIMGARTIEDPKARLTTILIAPLMSCSARLPVYVLMVGAFVEPHYGVAVAAATVFAMHVVGLAVSVPIAFTINRLFLRTRTSPFLMEMPAYRVPLLRDVLWRMWQRGREFIIRAGTVIFAMSIIIWALCYFPRSDAITQDYIQQLAAEQSITAEQAQSQIEADTAHQHAIDSQYIEQSYMGRIGKTVQPVFDPAGFDWKITVGVLASFPAREVIISTMGIVYALGGEVSEESADLRSAMASATWTQGPRAGQSVFTPLVALSVMVFFALCMQCGATLTVIARESSWKWAAFSFVYMTTLAWAASVLVHQVGSAFFGA
ncbi:MAG: ferrous iron transport protein B [Planctomycetaceae bacterium]|nr:ferrous iron transport protein B [Planctomycetaceae bacterium]